MKEDRLLEAALPDVDIRWVQLGGPTAIREGMLSGDIDVGFMGIGPMLIGVDTGMPWKCFTALSGNEVAFITNKARIKTPCRPGPGGPHRGAKPRQHAAHLAVHGGRAGRARRDGL